MCAAFGGGVVLVLLHDGFDPRSATANVLFSGVPSLTPEKLEAQAAVVYDPGTGKILFAKNADISLPLASITKLMTAEIVLSSKDPNTPITITARMLAPAGDWGFRAGDTVPLKELLKFGLIASSNDAMQAAAESLGPNYIEYMNTVAGNLELNRTHFLNPTGLDISSSVSGAYSSAYDVARLAALFYRQFPSYFELTQRSSVSIQSGDRTLSAPATALPLLSTPGFIGAKTGYTDQAGGNLVAVFDVEIGHPLIGVVLGSSHDGRFSDMQILMSAARRGYTDNTP
jgi:D-alanyl-D-alanine carboxypeptidase